MGVFSGPVLCLGGLAAIEGVFTPGDSRHCRQVFVAVCSAGAPPISRYFDSFCGVENLSVFVSNPNVFAILEFEKRACEYLIPWYTWPD